MPALNLSKGKAPSATRHAVEQWEKEQVTRAGQHRESEERHRLKASATSQCKKEVRKSADVGIKLHRTRIVITSPVRRRLKEWGSAEETRDTSGVAEGGGVVR